MSTDLNAKVTLGGLKYYHDKIFTDVLTPINTILWDNATSSDIGSLFDEEEPIPPNSIIIPSLPEGSTVTVKDSSNNTISSLTGLTIGETYNIQITREDAMNTFNVSFTADGTSSLIITNPVLYSELSNEFNSDGITANSYEVFNSKTTWNYNSVSTDYDLIINTLNKIKIAKLDFDFTNYATNVSISMYGSNDGENWTLIDELTGGDRDRNEYGRIARYTFDTSHNPGYTYTKLVFGRSVVLYAVWLSEAYWVD